MVTQSIFIPPSLDLKPSVVQLSKRVTERAEFFFGQRIKYIGRQQGAQLAAMLRINLIDSGR
jgi:hypothetical protein